MARLRKGKTKALLEASLDAALLAVEVYNKPRTTFRSEAYIALMVIAWTRLMHAHFYSTIGDRYYHKDDRGRFELHDGEKKAWELATCIRKYGKLSEAAAANLKFMIKLRNKIEHRHVAKREVDALIFGECQAMLYNYERCLIACFGENYAVNEALVYSLQFSHLRTEGQRQSSKSALSQELSDILVFIEKYRNGLANEIYDSLEYSIKLIQIPKISNTNRADAAIEFVRWDALNAEDRAAYEKLSVIIKDKRVTVEGVNVRRFKASEVVAEVNKRLPTPTLTLNLHVVMYKLLGIRPLSGAADPFNTNPKYCLYDETHNDYVYDQRWIDLLTHFLQTAGITPDELRAKLKAGGSLAITAFEI